MSGNWVVPPENTRTVPELASRPRSTTTKSVAGSTAGAAPKAVGDDQGVVARLGIAAVDVDQQVVQRRRPDADGRNHLESILAASSPAPSSTSIVLASFTVCNGVTLLARTCRHCRRPGRSRTGRGRRCPERSPVSALPPVPPAMVKAAGGGREVGEVEYRVDARVLETAVHAAPLGVYVMRIVLRRADCRQGLSTAGIQVGHIDADQGDRAAVARDRWCRPVCVLSASWTVTEPVAAGEVDDGAVIDDGAAKGSGPARLNWSLPPRPSSSRY